jgi:hypothetical protein
VIAWKICQGTLLPRGAISSSMATLLLVDRGASRVVHDVVTVEDAARLMPAEFDHHAFPDAGANHVADGGSTQIKNDDPRHVVGRLLRGASLL